MITEFTTKYWYGSSELEQCLAHSKHCVFPIKHISFHRHNAHIINTQLPMNNAKKSSSKLDCALDSIHVMSLQWAQVQCSCKSEHLELNKTLKNWLSGLGQLSCPYLFSPTPLPCSKCWASLVEASIEAAVSFLLLYTYFQLHSIPRIHKHRYFHFYIPKWLKR